jgi:hypothetical protein
VLRARAKRTAIDDGRETVSTFMDDLARGALPERLPIGIVGVNDELEGASVCQSHGREVPNVSRCEPADAEIFSQHDDSRVDETQAEIFVLTIDVHRAS